MLGPHLALVLKMRESQADHLRLGDLGQHPDQLRLHELIARERPRELFARFRVIECAEVTRSRRTDRSPCDSIARLRQTPEWTLESARGRQMRRLRNSHVLENQPRGDRCAHRKFSMNIAGRKSRSSLLDQKPGDTFINLRPYYRDIRDRAVGD